jgi:hypothetical protein
MAKRQYLFCLIEVFVSADLTLPAPPAILSRMLDPFGSFRFFSIPHFPQGSRPAMTKSARPCLQKGHHPSLTVRAKRHQKTSSGAASCS